MERSVILTTTSATDVAALPYGLRSVALPDGRNTLVLGQPSWLKIFVFTEILFCRTTRNSSARYKGRFATVTGRGPGCGGLDGVGALGRLQGGNPVSSRLSRYDTALTASSFGLDGERTPAIGGPAGMCADGEVVWS